MDIWLIFIKFIFLLIQQKVLVQWRTLTSVNTCYELEKNTCIPASASQEVSSTITSNLQGSLLFFVQISSNIWLAIKTTRCENPFGWAIKIKFLIAKHLSSHFSWCIVVEATSKQFFMWFGYKSYHHPLPRFLQLGRSLPKPFSSDHQLPTIRRCAHSNRALWSLITRLQSLTCFESTWVPAKQRLR